MSQLRVFNLISIFGAFLTDIACACSNSAGRNFSPCKFACAFLTPQKGNCCPLRNEGCNKNVVIDLLCFDFVNAQF